DSSYVAYVANAELGPRAVCITGQSASLPAYQRAEIDQVVQKFGFQHEIIQTEELENPGYRANNPDRCFLQRRVVHKARISGAHARHQEYCRWINDGRSRRLSSGTAGSVATRRAQSAHRG